MRRVSLVLLAVLAFPSAAAADTVSVLHRDGTVTRRNDPYLRTPADQPANPARLHVAGVRSAARRAARRAPVTVQSTLDRLRRSGAISGTTYAETLGAFNAALAAEKRLSGTRAAQIAAVTETVHQIAASGQLTASRLPAIVATLDANTEWWTSGSLLAPGARVEFAGSQLIWEYYAGEGLQLQVLGSFGKANGLFTAGPSQYPAMEQLLSEIIPLASRRAGGLAWEYYFPFDGGSPPWASAMAQATGLQALTRAYLATHDPAYLSVAAQAMPLFSRPPPAGVAVPTRRGVRYLQYTFAPSVSIINAFLQTLIGLYDYATVSGNPVAGRRFALGNAEAMWEVPQFNTGGWSLYQPGVVDPIDYHELVTGFLQQLCLRTKAPVYCTTAQDFADDLVDPPVIGDRTAGWRANRPFTLRFSIDKPSRVGLVIDRGDETVFATSAPVDPGNAGFSVPGLRAGTYTVGLAATSVTGRTGHTTGTLIIR